MRSKAVIREALPPRHPDVGHYRGAISKLPVALSLLLFAAALSSEVNAQVSCGATLMQDVTLTEDLVCPGEGLFLGAPGITLDCGGHAIRGAGSHNTRGVSAVNVAAVTIRDCVLSGFSSVVYLNGSHGSRVERNTIVGDPFGQLYSVHSPSLTVEGNAFVGPRATALVAYGPDSRFSGNSFDPVSRDPNGHSFVSFYGSPRSVFSGNVSAGTVHVAFSNHSDGSYAADNRLSGGSQIALTHSTESRITRNRLGPVDPAAPFGNGGVSLFGASGNEISDNEIDGHRIWGLFFIDDEAFQARTDSNVVRGNTIRDASIGIQVYSGGGNWIFENDIQQSVIGIAVFGIPGQSRPLRNTFERNTILGGQYGLYLISGDGNVFSGNMFKDQDWGVFEILLEEAGREPTTYIENDIEGSRIFGLLAWGASPKLLDNRLTGNGVGEDAPKDPIDALVLEFLGGRRGGLAFLPWVGDADVTTLDDADPSTDVLAAPLVGNLDHPNAFSGNSGVDVYALDCRAENWRTLASDNAFDDRGGSGGDVEPEKETHDRIRQDWFGLIRVEDLSGSGVQDATVEVRDARGRLAGPFTSGSEGYAPGDVDPNRTEGLVDGEPSGPLPSWPRFTEYVVDGNGSRADLTPHHITAHSPAGMGRSIYSWDAVENDPLSFRIVDGRYQTAKVVLDKRPGSQ